MDKIVEEILCAEIEIPATELLDEIERKLRKISQENNILPDDIRLCIGEVGGEESYQKHGVIFFRYDKKEGHP